jgi:hypothetical protein
MSWDIGCIVRMWSDVSEELITSIFRVEYLPCRKASCSRLLDNKPAKRDISYIDLHVIIINYSNAYILRRLNKYCRDPQRTTLASARLLLWPVQIWFQSLRQSVGQNVVCSQSEDIMPTWISFMIEEEEKKCFIGTRKYSVFYVSSSQFPNSTAVRLCSQIKAWHLLSLILLNCLFRKKENMS